MKKIRKYEIYSVSLVLFLSLFVLNNIYAQIDSLRSADSIENNLEQRDDSQVVESGTRELMDNSETASSDDITKEPEKVVNTLERENMITSEDVGKISETNDQIRNEAEITEDSLRQTIKTGIDENIVNIRTKSDIQAYELQKEIDEDRLNLYENIDNTLNSVNLNNAHILDNLSDRIDSGLQRIESSLESRSGLEANFERERRSITDTILRLKKTVEEKRKIIEDRDAEDMFIDSDNDGVSDYDEKNIYKTDPNRKSTLDDGETDSEKIIKGINPLNNKPIEYQDPRDDQESYVTSAYKLRNVSLIKKDNQERVLLEGRALPNSFITLYIFSTPIIVTLKTGETGDWEYELDKELENGEHQVYVATVNNSGKIVARSNPILFTKTAEAASLGILGVDIETSQAGDFFRDNFILISLAILILLVILALMFIGNNKNLKDTVTDLKKEVDGQK